MEDVLDKEMTLDEKLAQLDPDTLKLIGELMARDKAKEDIAPEEEDHDTVARDLVIKLDRRYGFALIRRKGGGRVPTILKSSFTDMEKAERALDLWKKGLLEPQGRWHRERLAREAEAASNRLKQSFEA